MPIQVFWLFGAVTLKKTFWAASGPDFMISLRRKRSRQASLGFNGPVFGAAKLKRRATVLFLCMFCFVIDRPDGVDIALLYALMNFIATIAVLKFFRYRALDVSLATAHIDKDVDGGQS